MVECPVCFGDGGWDDRDLNALLTEHLPDWRIADLRAAGMMEERTECPSCKGRGEVTEDVALDILAAGRASFDQFLCWYNEHHG